MLEKKALILPRYAAVTLLILVAVAHFFLSRNIPISPWKGGSFGMFSTVSAPHSYFIRVYSKSPSENKFRIIVPEKLKAFERNLRYFPAMRSFTKFKTALLKEKWVLYKDSVLLRDAAGNFAPDQYKAVDIKDVTIELWQYKFNKETAQLCSSLLLAL